MSKPNREQRKRLIIDAYLEDKQIITVDQNTADQMNKLASEMGLTIKKVVTVKTFRENNPLPTYEAIIDDAPAM